MSRVNHADEIRRLSKELGRPISTLIALTTTNDPFHASTDGRLRNATWFADLYRKLEVKPGAHIRRIHYRIISQPLPIPMVSGEPYQNTMKCWQALKEACRDARYNGLVDPADFADQRNNETIVNLPTDGDAAELYIDNAAAIAKPEWPMLLFSMPTIAQRYHLEIIAEKSTVNDILEPLGRRYGINVTACLGQISLTRCFELIQRAKASRRPTIILYVSDFDPAGDNMPVACARKIEFLVRDGGLDLEIQLQPVVLTVEQCSQYRLPRTPIKDGDSGKAHFEARYGGGATELDALEALHPGELARILEREIARYYDIDLREAVEEVAGDIDADIDAVNDAVREGYEERVAALEAEFEALEERRKSLCQGMEDSIREQVPNISDIQWPEPKDGDEAVDPLFDSARDYVEQIDRYKLHQGKPTERKGKERAA